MQLPDITIKLRDVIIAVVFIAGLLVTATWGYFQLLAKAEAGERAANSVSKIECDIRQLKNFMIHGVRPMPHETCERNEK